MARTWMLWMCLPVFFACGNSPIKPDDDALANVLALSELDKAPIAGPTGEIVGLVVSVDVINTGPVPIEQVFVMTWRLREGPSTLAAATHRFSGPAFERFERRRVTLQLSFPPRTDLSGIQDVVTFAFE